MAASSSADSERTFEDVVARSRRPGAGERGEHRVGVLVAQDRDHEGVVGAVELSCEPGGALGVVRPVANLVAHPLEPARQRDLHLALDGTPQERLRGLTRPADDDVRPRQVRELLVREHCDRPLLDDRELLGRDLGARLPEDVRVVEANVRQQDDVRAEDVRRVEPATETRLDDRDVDLARGELGEGGCADRLELRRPLRLRLRPDASDRGLEVDVARRRR